MKKSNVSVIAASLLGASVVVSGCATSHATNHATTSRQPVMQPQVAPPPTPREPVRMPSSHSKHGGKRSSVWKNLDLTDAQQAQIEQLNMRNNLAMKPLKVSIAQQDTHIAQQKQAGADTATLLALHQQRQNSVEQMMTLKKQQHQQMLAILTPEQQLKFYERQAEHRASYKRGTRRMSAPHRSDMPAHSAHHNNATQSDTGR